MSKTSIYFEKEKKKKINGNYYRSLCIPYSIIIIRFDKMSHLSRSVCLLNQWIIQKPTVLIPYICDWKYSQIKLSSLCDCEADVLQNWFVCTAHLRKTIDRTLQSTVLVLLLSMDFKNWEREMYLHSFRNG